MMRPIEAVVQSIRDRWHGRADSIGPVKAPDPLVVTWCGQHLRVHHDDPRLTPYSPQGATIRSAVELASDVEGLRLALITTVGDRYRVRVSDDGSVVGLWRISEP
jgi:hypothetical protein